MELKNSGTPSEDCQKRIREIFQEKMLGCGICQGDFWLRVLSESLLSVIEGLRSDSLLLFDSFVDLCGVDRSSQPSRFEVVIHLWSRPHKHRIRIHCLVPDDTLTIPSLTSLWKAANWQEREAFDMYGILFSGHPKLERILSPAQAEVFPQRKDYPLQGNRAPKEFSQ